MSVRTRAPPDYELLLSMVAWRKKIYRVPIDEAIKYAERLGISTETEAADLLAAWMVHKGLISEGDAEIVIAENRRRMRRYLEKLREWGRGRRKTG